MVGHNCTGVASTSAPRTQGSWAAQASELACSQETCFQFMFKATVHVPLSRHLVHRSNFTRSNWRGPCRDARIKGILGVRCKKNGTFKPEMVGSCPVFAQCPPYCQFWCLWGTVQHFLDEHQAQWQECSEYEQTVDNSVFWWYTLGHFIIR